MHRSCLLSLVVLAGACSSRSKAPDQPAPVYETKEYLVNNAASAVMQCSQINVFDTFFKNHKIADGVAVIDPAQIPDDIESLSLGDSEVLDLTPVFGRKFKFLDVSFTRFTAWDQLAQFPELEALAVGGFEIDLMSLLNMKQVLPHLKRLYISNTNLETDGLQLTAFPNLEGLSLFMVRMSDPSAFAAKLADLPSLKTLHLERLNPFADRPTVDLGPFATLTQLRHVTVSEGRVVGWESLGRMTFLKSLQVKNRDKELQPQHIADLTELETLDLSSTEWPAYDFSRQKNLKHLCLAANNISDLAAVAPLDHLETLDLRGNRIESLHPLKDLGKLQNLVLVQDYAKDMGEGFNPIVQPEKRSSSNCPADAQASVVRDFCTPQISIGEK